MENAKSIIRHEILNTLTAINMIAAGSKMSHKDKEELLQLVKVTGLLISHEEVILGKHVQFLKERFGLADVLDLIAAIHEEKIKENRIKLVTPQETAEIEGDKTSLKNFLEELFLALYRITREIVIAYDPNARILTVSPKVTGETGLKQKSLMSCITEKGCLKDELPLQLALHLLEMSGVKVAFDRKKISVEFPR